MPADKQSATVNVLNLETSEELQMETDECRRKYYEMQARVAELRAKLEGLQNPVAE